MVLKGLDWAAGSGTAASSQLRLKILWFLGAKESQVVLYVDRCDRIGEEEAHGGPWNDPVICRQKRRPGCGLLEKKTVNIMSRNLVGQYRVLVRKCV